VEARLHRPDHRRTWRRLRFGKAPMGAGSRRSL